MSPFTLKCREGTFATCVEARLADAIPSGKHWESLNMPQAPCVSVKSLARLKAVYQHVIGGYYCFMTSVAIC